MDSSTILFPHKKVRPVQDKFLEDALIALKEKKHFLAHAPTGIGKTCILSAILPHSLNNKKTIFFLTSRHTQHKIVIETLKKIKQKYNKNIIVADFIGKKFMCQISGVSELSSSEFADYCRDLVEKRNCYFYNNIKKGFKLTIEARKVLEKLKNEIMSVEEVSSLCFENKLCPYEITSILAKESHIIIADYNYILNPSIRDSLLSKIELSLDDLIIIFDEAHNLPERAREILTVKISSLILNNAEKEAISLGYKEMSEDIKEIQKILEKFAQELPIDKNETLIKKESFQKQVEKIADYHELIGNSRFIAEQILEHKKASYNNTLANFLESWLGPDESFTRILKKGFTKKGNSFIELSYKCLDPSLLIKSIANASLIIGMSGTLTPLEMYQDLFGIKAVLKEYPNPFPKENRLNLIIPKTTTKFTQRNSKMYEEIANITSSLINTIPGNSIIFFPSYQIRNEIYNYFQTLSKKTTFLEQQNLTKQDKESLIENFKSYKKQGSVLLAASSGNFGEGIDLKGDLLKAVIIVGLPLSKPDLETQELINYYEKRFKKGWEYGYICPAFLKAMQNAGRCIRSSKDKGIIIFLDERYLWKNYFKCFPKNWDIKITNLPEEKIRKFFN